MESKLEKYFIEAAGKRNEDFVLDNPYRIIGFDGPNRRMGWAKKIPFQRLKEILESLFPVINDKEDFVFVGMGGSVNGIKPLFNLVNKRGYYTLDNLDPNAFLTLVSEIKDLDKTLVIPISKSGTTKETQLLAKSLKVLFSKSLGEQKWKNNFLWMSDLGSFEKLDSLGWSGVKKVAIQLDDDDDIGGRFSCPHTLIFLLPLFLSLDRDFEALENIYVSFQSLQNKIRDRAYSLCENYEKNKNAYFSPIIGDEFGESFSSWIVQLFQESLGSKDDKLSVKTLINIQNNDLFSEILLGIAIESKMVLLMSQMYFFQVFVAYYAALKEINFVDQGYVEQYKKEMGLLEGQNSKDNAGLSKKIEEIINEVKQNINYNQKFIEIVLYFYPSIETIKFLKDKFEKEFNDKIVLLFIGSDWNHHSYQAAFAAKDTFYVLLTLDTFNTDIDIVPKEIFEKNIETLNLITRATYLTIKDKAVYCSLNLD